MKEPADTETAAADAAEPLTPPPTDPTTTPTTAGPTSTTEPTAVLATDRLPAMRLVNGAVKVGLAVAFFVALVLQPEVVEGKAMGFRAPLFLAPAVIVPVLARWRDWEPYPHTADALLSAPFLVDTLGNLFGFYDSFDATDDVLHVLNWVLLAAAYHAFRFRNVHHNREAVFLGYGFGALAIVWWEILEWLVSTDGIGGAGGLSLTYGDTIGDLLLSSTGGLIGSIIGVRLLGAARDAAVRR
ncbi:MAG: hypothetical protein AAGA65_25615 [Actinomycetota bacterium]